MDDSRSSTPGTDVSLSPSRAVVKWSLLPEITRTGDANEENLRVHEIRLSSDTTREKSNIAPEPTQSSPLIEEIKQAPEPRIDSKSRGGPEPPTKHSEKQSSPAVFALPASPTPKSSAGDFLVHLRFQADGPPAGPLESKTRIFESTVFKGGVFYIERYDRIFYTKNDNIGISHFRHPNPAKGKKQAQVQGKTYQGTEEDATMWSKIEEFDSSTISSWLSCNQEKKLHFDTMNSGRRRDGEENTGQEVKKRTDNGTRRAFNWSGKGLIIARPMTREEMIRKRCDFLTWLIKGMAGK